MKHGSLFSGIGGFDLAAEWMGWENIFHCEWNEFGKKVLNYYWPQSISYHDITKTDFTIHRGNIDILTGGFPCQPYSMAGKRLGKEDERHLWPEMLRAIKEIQPRWVVGENVYGLVNWSEGLVFHEVQTDLEAEGYEVFPYVLPACSVNAPHRRDRVWFVAYANGIRSNAGGNERWCNRNIHRQYGQAEKKIGEWNGIDGCCKDGTSRNAPHPSSIGLCGDSAAEQSQFEALGTRDGMGENAPHPNTTRCENWDEQHRGQQTQNGEGKCCTCGYCIGIDQSNAPHPNGNGFNECDCQHEINTSEGGQYAQRNIEQMGEYNDADTNGIGLRREGNRFGKSRFISQNEPGNNWQNFPTQSPICTGDDGLSSRLDGITFSKWRNESIKAAGNAIVPQVVYQIFKAIQEYEATQTPTV